MIKKKLTPIVSVKEIEPEPSLCLTVESKDRLFSDAQGIVSHNSTIQRNILVAALMRAYKNDTFKIVGIDLKRVEFAFLRKYTKAVLGVAVERAEALELLRFASEEMMRRYAKMEEMGVTNVADLDTPVQNILLIIDELAELMEFSGSKAPLVASTLIKTPGGHVPLSSIDVGDIVYDSFSRPTSVVLKYKPDEQGRFDMSFSSGDNSGVVTAGETHRWNVYMEFSSGVRIGPVKHTTETLYRIQEMVKNVDEDVRPLLKIKKIL